MKGLLVLLAATTAWAEFSYTQGQLTFRGQSHRGGSLDGSALSQLSHSATLALPQPVMPELRRVSAEWMSGQAIAEARCQLQAGPSHPGGASGSPERYRDLYLVTFTLANCPELRHAVFSVPIRSGLAAGDTRTLAAPENSPAEAAMRRMVLNYAESRNYRSMPKRTQATFANPSGSLAKQGTSLAATLTAAPLPARRLSVFTESEGIHVLTYAALQTAKVPVDRIEPKHLRLWRQSAENGLREVPIYVSGEYDGRFNPGDVIEFLGEASRGEKSHYSPYTREVCFLLTWESAAPGLRAPLTPVPVRPTARATPSGFTVEYHAETDQEVLRAFSTAEENITDLGDRVIEEELGEFWYWQRQGPEKDQMTVSFNLPYHPVAVGVGENQDRNLKVSVQMKGITNDAKADPDHHVRFLLNGKDISLTDGQANNAIWEGQNTHTWVSLPLSIGALKSGLNELTVQKVNDLRTSEGKPVEVQDAYLNWIRLSFPARYRASDGVARFSNRFKDSLGLRSFEVTGFQSDSLAVWDTRGRRLHGLDLRRESNGITARFADSLITQVDYIAADYAKRIAPKMRLDTLPDLLNPTQGADWVCITAPSLLGKALDSLVAHRKSQGLRTSVVLAQHIYQTFGDGSTHPDAIRAFAKHAFDHWPRPAPSYLVLLGETSLWHDKLASQDRPNLVPTRLIDIRGWGVAANDDYFAKVSGADDVPDLMVGRIPVATREALSQIVNKILRHEKERDAGAWSNQALLIGGYEAAFSAGNAIFQARALSLNRHTDRMDLFTASPYYRNLEQRRNFYRQLDSGLAYVQFFGHGGGSVWSDAGLLTLQALDKDSLKGQFAVPFMASLTCLTGYFEDPNERSLGEEMLRRPRNGAAAFYGASGYISTAAGTALGDALTAVALRAGKTTVGAMVQEAEWRVRQKTGSAFLPVLAEFNLLGDPAMTYRMPEVREGLQVDPSFLRPQNTQAQAAMTLRGKTQSLTQAEAVVQISQADSVWLTRGGQVIDKTFAADFSVTAPTRWSAGRAVVHAFSDTVSEVLVGRFAASDWWVDSVSLLPAVASYGDSVHLRFVLRTPYDSVTFESGLALYALGATDASDPASQPAFANTDQRLLAARDDGRIETTLPMVIPYPEAGTSPLPYLHVKMRLGLRVGGANAPPGGVLSLDETRTHAFALKPRPRLALRPQAITLPWQDSVGLYAHYQNTGPGEARNFKVTVTSLLPNTTRIYGKTLAGPLAFGQADSVFIPLPDSALRHRLQLDLAPEQASDAVAGALSADTLANLHTALLAPGTAWQADSTRLEVAAPPGNAGPLRVFMKRESLPNLPAHLQASAPEGFAYRLGTGSPLGASRRLDLKALPALAGSASWHWQPEDLTRAASAQAWLRLDSAVSAESEFAGPGYYAFLENSDASKPTATLQSRGQTLWPDDFVPQRTAIDIVLQDAQGIDLVRRPPVLKSQGRAIDTSQLSRDQAQAADQTHPMAWSQGLPTLARLRFTPTPSSLAAASGRDTLDLTVTDVSGNVLRQTFAYRLGEALSIRNLGSYPNPFADSAVFAYTLTDYCERVSLQVYSRSGRLVRRLSDDRAVGYREVIWDGKTDGGASIANGLYFLKVTARSGDRSETRTFKLFKKRRR
jgi:Peptidase family C25/FlgD Ig-like domain